VITKLTRANFLKAVGAGVAWMALMDTPNSEPAERLSNVQTFRSRPDLSPPTIAVTTQVHGTAPGYIFVAPKEGPGQDGPMILDTLGRLVWFSKGTYARDFKVQRYRGEPVLTWWEGSIVQGHGVGEYVIFDNSYGEMARVRAGNGYRGDLHEFLITPRDTALLTAYNAVPANLSRVGGPEHGAVWDSIAQELDIETGEVLFEWHSLEHVALEKSYYALPEDPEKPFDYFHINSIDIDSDGDLLICSRNTCAVYKVGRNTGEVLWQLGGKNSSFELGPGTRTAFQHDARRQKDGTITIFDNGAHPQVHDQSRGIVVELDMNKMRATLLREYTSPEKLLATSQGNVQMLPNTNVFIGWGSEPFFSEFSYDGRMLFNAYVRPEHESYRAFRFPWVGQPSEDPAVAAETGPDGKVTVYTSWNGATEVASWQVLAGPNPEGLKPVGSAPRDGFETAIMVHTAEQYVGVQAKDRSGRVLGISKVVKLGN
jgi:hypothetical protein